MNLTAFDGNAATAVRAFNALLVGTEKVRAGEIAEAAWRECGTLNEALALISGNDFDSIPPKARGASLGYIPSDFLDPDPVTGCQLEADLLIRHASGDLYQEAHFDLERSSQLYIGGMAPDPEYDKNAKRDARFTPPVLARALAQYAFRCHAGFTQDADLVILDPACGGGIFLQESFRELVARGFHGSVRLVGFDTSEISEIISRFCLSRAVADAEGVEARIDIQRVDALNEKWPDSDFVLSNPPFASWNKMSAEDRTAVKNTLGDVFKGKVDKAMAFVWLAAQSLKAGGALASIIPSPVLESESGSKWRQGLSRQMRLRLVGKFAGFGFFQNAMVEPAFVVMNKIIDANPSIDNRVTIVMAEEGSEDAALRAVRRQEAGIVAAAEDHMACEVVQADARSAFVVDWMPRSGRAIRLREKLAASNLLTVGDLFKVDQGIITGKNEVFILPADEVKKFPLTEQRYFRPAAGTDTIRNGQLLVEEFVFYPYGPGRDIKTEEELKNVVPMYFETILKDKKSELSQRQRKTVSDWWTLAEPRHGTLTSSSKLVTAYFGSIGNFAYDPTGEALVTHGYGWLWTGAKATQSSSLGDEGDEDGSLPFDFHKSPLPWAYLALCNSSIFERLMDLACPRLQGGQFNLSMRYINNVFIPDLTDDNSVFGSAVAELAQVGRNIHEGHIYDRLNLSRIVANIYQIPLEQWRLGERSL